MDASRPSSATPSGPPDDLDVVGYLDAVADTAFAGSYKRRTYDLLDVGPGSRVLDVGCGTGDDVLALAERVAPDGEAVGVDLEPSMVAEAWRRASEKERPARFLRGDAHDLDLDDGSFDGVRADRMLQHVERPGRVVEEMARLAGGGGRVVAGEPDWETLVVDSGLPSTTRDVVGHLTDVVIPNGRVGRRLKGLFLDAGLEEVEVFGGAFVLTDFDLADEVWGLRRHAGAARRAGAITREDEDAWIADLERSDQRGRFFSAVVGFVAHGRKP